MSKWSERQEEMKQGQPQQMCPTVGGSSSSSSHPEPLAKAGDPKKDEDYNNNNNDDNNNNKTITRTAKGEPICVLCQRKFPTIEKLRYHEQASKLHAENLKKKKQQQQQQQQQQEKQAARSKTAAAVTATESTELSIGCAGQQKKESVSTTSNYVDRARQRRELYGDDAGTTATLNPVSASSSLAVTGAAGGGVLPPLEESTETVVCHGRPEELLGTSNVGNQMLHKLGWKSGQALGRRKRQSDENNKNNQDDTDDGQEEEEAPCIQDDGNQELRKDWERIEALALSLQRKYK